VFTTSVFLLELDNDNQIETFWSVNWCKAFICDLLCLTQFLTTYQLYRGGQFYW